MVLVHHFVVVEHDELVVVAVAAVFDIIEHDLDEQ